MRQELTLEYRHSFHVNIRGKDVIVPVAGLAKRYWGLMLDAVNKIP